MYELVIIISHSKHDQVIYAYPCLTRCYKPLICLYFFTPKC